MPLLLGRLFFRKEDGRVQFSVGALLATERATRIGAEHESQTRWNREARQAGRYL